MDWIKSGNEQTMKVSEYFLCFARIYTTVAIYYFNEIHWQDNGNNCEHDKERAQLKSDNKSISECR